MVDDTKVSGKMDSEGYLRLQRDLDQLGQRAKELQLEFNSEKCELLDFGRTNKGRTYTVSDSVLL